MKVMMYMNKARQYSTGLLLSFGLCFSAYSEITDESQDVATKKESIHYRVSYKSKVEPVPLNRIHSWVLHVEALDGKPVEKARIGVYGGMPKHKHGLPTQPAISELGKGDYLVEGLKFSMKGWWQMWFNIRAGKVTDKVKFNIKL